MKGKVGYKSINGQLVEYHDGEAVNPPPWTPFESSNRRKILRNRGWRAWGFVIFEDIDNPKHKLRMFMQITWGWQGALARVERFFSYHITARRRKSWPLNHALNYGWLNPWYERFKMRLMGV